MEDLKTLETKFEKEVGNLNDIDTINKLYRQFRVWSYISEIYANTITHSERHRFNYRLKQIRYARFVELGLNNKEA